MTSVYSPYIKTEPDRTGCRRPDRRHGQRYAGRPGGCVTDAVNIDEFLREAGFDLPDAHRRAREILESHALTHAGKQGFVSSKVAPAQALLAETLLRICSDSCLAIDRAGAGRARESVRVTVQSCEICGGSNNRRAAIECVRALQHRRITRLVVVGGTPHLWQELRSLLHGTGLEIRYVDGTKASHTAKDALANTRWAQLIVIWGPTPLRHAISNLYTADPPPTLRVVTITRRSISALCTEVTRSFT